MINNRAANGGAIGCWDNSEPLMLNNTVIANEATTGGAVYSSASQPAITNSILRENNAQSAPQFYNSGSSYTVSYSCLQETYDGTGNIVGDPLFEGSGNQPYALTQYSPCINSGNSETSAADAGEYDIIGNSRIYNETVIDMGAYEYQGTTIIEKPENLTIQMNGSQVLLKWNKVEAANSYVIFGADKLDGEFTEITTCGTDTTWSEPVSGAKKFYSVAASTHQASKGLKKDAKSKVK